MGAEAVWDWVGLASELRRGTLRNLLEMVGPGSALRGRSAEQLADLPGIGPVLADRIQQTLHKSVPEDIADRYQRLAIRPLLWRRAGFPECLVETEEPPALLFACGRPVTDWSQAVAVVGTRKPTAYGVTVARTLARDLAAAGAVVVSGLALGIDAAAHRGALEGGGCTVAVLGCGMDHIYPRQNVGLYRQIKEQGLLISEYLLGTPPLPFHFPERNRILAGLCRAVVVVEAGDRSGTMSTVHHAIKAGRDVFAVPGPVTSPLSAGPNRLLSEGAGVVRDATDVLDFLNLGPGRPRSSGVPDLGGAEAAVYECLAQGPQTVDDLARLSELSVATVMAVIGLLQVRGMITHLPGHKVGRA